MADPANSVAVATGSLIVTGTLTSFLAAENDLFVARGAAVPIARRDGPNQITLKQPWPLASLTGEEAWSILSLGEYWRSAITTNRRLVDLLAKWEVVSPFRFDEAGPLSGRAAYNDQPKGFIYAAVDQIPVRVYIKLANTNSEADWSVPIYIGSGGQVEFEEAIAAERQARIGAISAARASLEQADADEAAARAFADGQLRGRIEPLETEAASVRTALNDEGAARAFADTQIRGRLDPLESTALTHGQRLNSLDVSAARSNTILSGDEPYYLLAPTHMFFIKGRRQTLNPARLVTSITEASRYKPSLTLTGGDGVVGRGYEASDGWEVALDDAYTSATVEMRDKMGPTQRRYARPASVFVSTDAFPSGTARKVALIGDSMTNYCRAYEERSILTSLGLAVQYVGTANTSGDRSNPGDQTGPLAEARPGIAFADYINKTSVLQPVPVGQEAAYLAMSKGERMVRNPFIRLATGSDPANRIFNGYVFDYGFYLTRFGLPVPDDVVLALGYNDIFNNAANATQALNDIDLGLLVMVSSIRSAAPNARIGLLTYAQARHPAADAGWAGRMAEYIRRHILFQVNFADPRVFMLGGHLAMSLDAASIIDPATRVNYPDGSFYGDVTDPTHPDRANYAKVAEVTAAFVAAGLNTPADPKRVNATTFAIGGRTVLQQVAGVYTRHNDPSGNGYLIAGNDGDPASYHNNGGHYLQSKDGGTLYAAFLASVARFNTPVRLPSYTVATVPSAAAAGQGAQIYVSNESGGPVTAFSDASSWRRVTDRSVIS